MLTERETKPKPDQDAPPIRRVMVTTDRSATAERAVRWAANLARPCQAELIVAQILPAEDETIDRARAAASLEKSVMKLGVARTRIHVVVSPDVSAGILQAADDAQVDVLVVGNVGMAGRKRFLLGNVPNRVSHNARCTVVIVNTSDAETDAEERDFSKETPDQQQRDLFGRAWHIGRVLVKAGFKEAIRRHRAGDEAAMQDAAVRLRKALDELGPTFAKLGQILSTRPDLLPKVFIDELATLQERVTPMTEAEVVEVMEQELHVPWEDVFESFHPEPLAAGTIAEVHLAKLDSGEDVVVKVQRPNAEFEIMEDLGLLEMFARRATNRSALREVFDVPVIVRELSHSLRRELDFRREAANLKRMRQVLEPFTRLAVPGLYEEYSTSRLLVMEDVRGVSIHEVPEGQERKEAARQLLEAFYHQIMSEGFFHADPHPGNLKWWNGKIYLLDLGMVGEVEPRLRHLILLMMLAFSQKDAPFLTEIVLSLASLEGGVGVVDFEAFRGDMEDLIERYREKSLREMKLGPIFQEVTEISVRRNVRTPASLALMGKAFAQMQLVAAELDPTLDPFEVAEQYVLRHTLRHATHGLNPQKIFYDFEKARERMSRLMEGVEQIVGARPGSNLQIDFRGTDRLEKAIQQSSKRISLALGLGGAMIAAASIARLLADRTPRR
jgi:ubiquinone biosynthesis protein